MHGEYNSQTKKKFKSGWNLYSGGVVHRSTGETSGEDKQKGNKEANKIWMDAGGDAHWAWHCKYQHVHVGLNF